MDRKLNVTHDLSQQLTSARAISLFGVFTPICSHYSSKSKVVADIGAI